MENQFWHRLRGGKDDGISIVVILGGSGATGFLPSTVSSRSWQDYGRQIFISPHWNLLVSVSAEVRTCRERLANDLPMLSVALASLTTLTL